MDMETVKIGVLDSGVGGLSVLREIHRLLPDYPTLYFADQGHLPYGPRSTEELFSFVEAITHFLRGQGAGVIVIACNTASAASLLELRARYPQIPFVGMEPAVKPAAAASKSRVIGVLSTKTTANGALYQRVLERYAADCRVITQIAPELVQIVEANSMHTTEGRRVIQRILQPLLDAGADQIALACTHFSFLSEVIQEIVGAGVGLVDPGPAVARQTARVITNMASVPQGAVPAFSPAVPTHRYFTSGDANQFQQMLKQLLAVDAAVEHIRL